MSYANRTPDFSVQSSSQADCSFRRNQVDARRGPWWCRGDRQRGRRTIGNGTTNLGLSGT
jgi:hypothetical protein